MPQIPQCGVIIYANDLEKVANFYVEMFGLSRLRATPDLISLGSEHMNIVVHVPPIEIPELNFNCVKIFMTVESFEKARQKAVDLGGHALPGEWANPVFKICNIADPEGNAVQLREFI